MSTNTLDWVLRILVGKEEHFLSGLFFFSISASLTHFNVCSKLLFTEEFENNLAGAFLTRCIYIFLIKFWFESISSGAVLFYRFRDCFVTESRTKSNLFLCFWVSVSLGNASISLASKRCLMPGHGWGWGIVITHTHEPEPSVSPDKPEKVSFSEQYVPSNLLCFNVHTNR